MEGIVEGESEVAIIEVGAIIIAILGPAALIQASSLRAGAWRRPPSAHSSA